MRGWLAMIYTLMSISAWASAPQARTLSLDDIRRVETLVKMPPGAGSISGYNRFYAIKVEAGHEMIWGTFLLTNRSPPLPTIHIVRPEEMPAILDGGCSVVHLLYDIREAKITSIFCNGVA